MTFYVDRMITDEWSGVLCDERQTSMPTVDDVRQAIRALDAKTKTLVSLYGPDGAYLTIGGGAGLYVVYASILDEQLFNLVSDAAEKKSGVIMINAGGQEGDFPARQVVAEHQGLLAAETFLKTGMLDRSLCWERQA